MSREAGSRSSAAAHTAGGGRSGRASGACRLSAREGASKLASRARSLAKLQFWKRKSATITDADPCYRVIYLGNVLTGWAKGEGCVEKPLSTLWRNHVGSEKPDIIMRVTVVGSGLRATTQEHGLTEYWTNRITHCSAHDAYPRVFCWIYRHEGRKLKQELRCHAVLCHKDGEAKLMAEQLQNRLHQALVDFRKEKISRQNARLSLANCIYDNPSVPYRKLLLQPGTNNYKPPIERSKSAPKLTVIEEAELEDEDSSPEAMSRLYLAYRDIATAASSATVSPSEVKKNMRLPGPLEAAVAGDGDDGMLIFGHHEDTDDEDEVRDYIGCEADSAASESPPSQNRSTGSQEDWLPEEEDHDVERELLAKSVSRVELAEQDNISDESGYSEEPLGGANKSAVTVLTVRLGSSSSDVVIEEEKQAEESREDHRLEIQVSDVRPGQAVTITRLGPASARLSSASVELSNDSGPLDGTAPASDSEDADEKEETADPPPAVRKPSGSDLSVKSVLLSEFTASEKLRYIERSNKSRTGLLVNKQEFCINI